MKKIILLSLSVTLTVTSFSQIDHKKEAVLVLDELKHKEFAKIIAICDSNMLSKIDAVKLEQVWNQLLGQLGVLQKSAAPTAMIKADLEYVDQVCDFEKMSLIFRLGFNKKDKISTLLFLPAPQVDFYKFPDYAIKEQYEETDIVVQTKSFLMGGTLTSPKGVKNFPIVILIHGSGPGNRDEEIGKIKVFKDLAVGLASNGVGVIRYDKRTFVYGMKSCENMDSLTVKEEVIEDVASAVKLAQTIEGADKNKIFLIGHSLGAMLMPRMASEIKGLAGVIMMAGNARPLEDVYMEQIMYLANLDGKFTDEDRAQLEQVKLQIMKVKKLGAPGFNPAATELPLNINAKYWYDLKKYKQVEVAKKLILPVLILQGQRDYQVTMQDFTLWQNSLSAKPNFTLKSYPKLNHAFTEGDEAKSKPDEYDKQANVPEYVIKDIVDFVKK